MLYKKSFIAIRFWVFTAVSRINEKEDILFSKFEYFLITIYQDDRKFQWSFVFIGNSQKIINVIDFMWYIWT